MPPLRDRPEDMPVLAEFFAHKYARAMARKILGITRQTRCEKLTRI